jgi:membrane-associated protease RseP (regulator of RpoE activity)
MIEVTLGQNNLDRVSPVLWENWHLMLIAIVIDALAHELGHVIAYWRVGESVGEFSVGAPGLIRFSVGNVKFSFGPLLFMGYVRRAGYTILTKRERRWGAFGGIWQGGCLGFALMGYALQGSVDGFIGSFMMTMGIGAYVFGLWKPLAMMSIGKVAIVAAWLMVGLTAYAIRHGGSSEPLFEFMNLAPYFGFAVVEYIGHQSEWYERLAGFIGMFSMLSAFMQSILPFGDTWKVFFAHGDD